MPGGQGVLAGDGLSRVAWNCDFHGIPGVAGNQSLPCVKGGGVRKDTGGIDAEQLEMQCKIRLLQNHFSALQRSAPSGGHIFRITTKDMEERRAKERFVLWNFR